jgi:broad specificity phosphatase PhoE
MGTVTFDLVRHADAAKVPGIEDVFRPLSAKGIEQAVAAQAAYASDAARVKLGFHSPAPRAFLTQIIMLGTGRPVYHVLPSMWPPAGHPLDKAFEKYGYTVSDYLTDTGAAALLDEHGREVAAKIWSHIGEAVGGIVHIAGHAVLLNAVAFHLSRMRLTGVDRVEKGDMSVFDYEMAPCSRLRLVLEDEVYRGCTYRPL